MEICESAHNTGAPRQHTLPSFRPSSVINCRGKKEKNELIESLNFMIYSRDNNLQSRQPGYYMFRLCLLEDLLRRAFSLGVLASNVGAAARGDRGGEGGWISPSRERRRKTATLMAFWMSRGFNRGVMSAALRRTQRRLSM
jgi:hypothetical protein